MFRQHSSLKGRDCKMKMKSRKLSVLFFLLLTAVMLLFGFTPKAFADEPSLSTSYSFYLYKNGNNHAWLYMNGDSSSSKYSIKKVTVSDKSVMTVKKAVDCGQLGVNCTLKKAGKVTVRLWLKNKKSGKVTKYSAKVQVTKYSNPVKTLKIGSKNYAKYFKNNNYGYWVKKSISGKILITPSKGWELIEIAKVNQKNGRMSYPKYVKNKKFTISNNYSCEFGFRNKKTGMLCYVCLGVQK